MSAKPNRPRVFISYSRRDDAFARQLEASLRAAGADTFIDVRDIKIGESIPDRVFQEIRASSFVICIVSATSVSSRWVNEELAAARMKSLEGATSLVLPLLIEDVPVPDSISHIRYADLREWHEPKAYRAGLLQLLRVLNLTPRVLHHDDIEWYVQQREMLAALEREILVSAGILESGVLATVLWRSDPSMMHVNHRTAYNAAIAESRLIEHLLQLDADLIATSSPRLGALRDSISPVADLANVETRRDPALATTMVHRLHVVAKLIEGIRADAETILVSVFESPSEPSQSPTGA